MDIQYVLAIVFMIGMGIFLYVRRKSLVIQKILGPFVYFAMYRDSWGLDGMDWLAKKLPRTMRGLFYFGIVVGFLGMIVISYTIVTSTFQLFAQPELAPGIQPVLPVSVKGVFYVPFTYWIISIFVIAAVHEFAHGVAARAHNIPVKSSGFAFLGVILPVIPAAFVEPDEKKLINRPMSHQLSVFAAGPLANVLLSFFIIFAFGFAFPGVPAEVSHAISIVDLPQFAGGLTQWNSLLVTGVVPDSPAAKLGVVPGLKITAINDVSVTDHDAFMAALDALRPGNTVFMTVNGVRQSFIAGQNPTDPNKAWIGLQFDTEQGPTPAAIASYGNTGYSAIMGGITLLIFIYALSLGIGLFNLLPLGPVDGGRMFQLAAEKILGDKRGHQVWKYTGFFFLGLIIINLTIGFVR